MHGTTSRFTFCPSGEACQRFSGWACYAAGTWADSFVGPKTVVNNKHSTLVKQSGHTVECQGERRFDRTVLSRSRSGSSFAPFPRAHGTATTAERRLPHSDTTSVAGHRFSGTGETCTAGDSLMTGQRHIIACVSSCVCPHARRMQVPVMLCYVLSSQSWSAAHHSCPQIASYSLTTTAFACRPHLFSWFLVWCSRIDPFTFGHTDFHLLLLFGQVNLIGYCHYAHTHMSIPSQ